VDGDSGVNDLAGNHNAPSVSNVSLVPGEVSDGFTFGNQGYVQVAQSPTLMNRRFTWLAWAKPTGHGPNRGNIMINHNIDGKQCDRGYFTEVRRSPFIFLFGNYQ